MKRISKIASLLILSSFLLFSCGEAEVIHEDILDPADIVLVTKEKTMAVGEKYQIQATYVNEKSEEEPATLLYKSLDTSIATVSSSGLVEAVGVGETVIQITYSKSKSLFKVIVEGNQDSSLLGLSIYDDSLLLYEGDEFTFKYESRLNGKLIDLNATYYDYDASIISIDNNVITALNAGETTAKIKVTYGELVAEESFSVTVQEVRYNLVCNYENSQVVAGEDDLYITYSLCYGSSLLKTLSLSEMDCSISDTSIASINGDVITGIKKGNFTISASYFISEIGSSLTSVDSFRCRERYTVKLVDLAKSISLLDGEYIDYVPVNDDKKLVFDTWLNDDGVEFNAPVESNLNLFTRWRINEFDFTQDTRDAKSIAPTVGEKGETIEAIPYNDYDIFSNGLKYTLSKNSSDDAQSESTMAHIYLPKMDYRQCNKVTYRWKTSGWVAINSYPDHWYDGALTLGGTIVVSYDGNVLTQTITQTDVSYSNDKITSICSDVDVIQGNKSLESLGYWTFESLTFTNYLYLSYPKITYVNCVDHHYINTPTIDKIGNYDLICCLCGKDGGLSEETMTLVDVNFIDNQYGAHGGRWGDVFPITETDAFRTERTLKYEISVANAEDQIFIPKINFKAFRKVQFEISCSSSSIGAGLESGSYILPVDGSNRSTGVMSFEVSGNSLVVSLTCNETGLTQQRIISDNDIINGNSPFGFFMYSTLVWQTVTIKPVLLAGTGPHNFINTIPTDKIGNYETICELCGEKGGYSEEAMNYSDVNFIDNQYGAHGGRWGDVFPNTETDTFRTEKTLKYEITAANTENEIFLPKINFKPFSKVEFTVTCGSFAIGAGLESGSYVLSKSSSSSSPAKTGVLILKMNEEKLEASLKCNETSEIQNIVITDSDIINGNKSFSLFMISDYGYQTVTIGLSVLAGPCVHHFVNVNPTNKIGYYDTVCELCGKKGEPSEEAVTYDEIDFTQLTYCAYGGRWGTNVQPTEKTMVYEITAGHAENEIFLPKIDFSAFTTISFNLIGNVWDARVGLESGNYAFPYLASGIHSGTLTFTYDGEKVNVELICPDGINQNLVVTDSDIISGEKSFSLFMTADDPYRTITIELLSLA